MKAVIILGCNGRQDNGFCFCTGVNNVLVDLEKIVHTANYKDLIRYLDKVPKIFDNSCFLSNIISNAVYKIYEMGYLSDIQYKFVSHFYDMHKRCGLVMKAEVKNG